MDYILFYSHYSPSSKKLFEDFPNLREKSISVDSQAMRMYMKKLHIVCVPTLGIIINNKIVEKIIGYDKIYNWVLITLYRTTQLQTAEEPEPQTITQIVDEPTETKYYKQPEIETEPMLHQQQTLATPIQNKTSLDDLILTDEPPEPKEFLQNRTEPKVQTGISGSTLQIAEALKKERDNDLETNNKKRIPN